MKLEHPINAFARISDDVGGVGGRLANYRPIISADTVESVLYLVGVSPDRSSENLTRRRHDASSATCHHQSRLRHKSRDPFFSLSAFVRLRTPAFSAK